MWCFINLSYKPKFDHEVAIARSISIPQLESLAESLFDFQSFEDAIEWLNNLN
ncbi:DUF4351 domain-containing protein [Geminocystis herdmanii]|uniref:DUF4351 domain-containing protein n=1 Tax=Geminocystis herdmanii TaxID=669359 RepID=UPI00034D4A71|nr:DUF4351 domain-containing protein [Geminocystis herdmanii]